jgi:hypothetical protein
MHTGFRPNPAGGPQVNLRHLIVYTEEVGMAGGGNGRSWPPAAVRGDAARCRQRKEKRTVVGRGRRRHT